MGFEARLKSGSRFVVCTAIEWHLVLTHRHGRRGSNAGHLARDWVGGDGVDGHICNIAYHLITAKSLGLGQRFVGLGNV